MNQWPHATRFSGVAHFALDKHTPACIHFCLPRCGPPYTVLVANSLALSPSLQRGAMEAMQVAASCAAPAALMASASCQRRASGSRQRSGVQMLSNFGGLKAESKVTSMGQASSTELEFSRVQAMCRGVGSGISRGGAAASTCDVGGEIIRIIPIMSALVLVGIAVGFVLLRVEAAVEEAE